MLFRKALNQDWFGRQLIGKYKIDGSPKTEDGSPKTKDRIRKLEVGSGKWEVGSG